MGARGRDRTTGRTLPLGWDEEDAPGAPADRPAPDPRPVGADDETPASDPHGLSRRSRRLIAVLAVLALVGALLIALPRLLGATGGPEQVTREYLQAVLDGDLETVRAHVKEESGVSSAALTAEILDDAENRPDSFEIQQVEIEAGMARVTAEVRTGPDRDAATFILTSHDAGAFSPTQWELDPVALPELRIDLIVGISEIEIEGVTFPVGDLLVDRETYEPRVAVQLLPGTYDVSLPVVPPWVEPRQSALEVPARFGRDDIPVHDLGLALDQAGRHEVQQQVDAALEECAASTSSTPENCPFAVPEQEENTTEAGEVEPVAEHGTWTLTDPPRIGSSPVSAFVWEIEGHGTAEFAPADGAAPIEVPFSAEGSAAITGQGDLEAHLRGEGAVSYGYCMDAETGVMTGAVVTDESGEVISGDCV